MVLVDNFRYFRKLYIAGGLIIAVILIGVSGFMLIEHYSFLDSFFMTIITVGTVGYGEVHQLSDLGKVFTSFLIIFSIGTFAYAISVITTHIVEGEFRHTLKNFVWTGIYKNNNHIIVCGLRAQWQASLRSASFAKWAVCCYRTKPWYCFTNAWGRQCAFHWRRCHAGWSDATKPVLNEQELWLLLT